MHCIRRLSILISDLQKYHLSQTMVSSNRYVGRLLIPWIDSRYYYYLALTWLRSILCFWQLYTADELMLKSHSFNYRDRLSGVCCNLFRVENFSCTMYNVQLNDIITMKQLRFRGIPCNAKVVFITTDLNLVKIDNVVQYYSIVSHAFPQNLLAIVSRQYPPTLIRSILSIKQIDIVI